MSVTRQQLCEMREDRYVSAAAVDERRARVDDLIGDRALSARSVLATALLGADQPHLTVGELVEMASLFGISDGAARTCLWRMVSNGELTSDDGTYALAGRLLERRQRVDEAARSDDTSAPPWDGTWELAVVSLNNDGRRPIGSRSARPPRRCTSPNYGKASGSGPTTSTATACRRCAPCWTGNVCTSTAPPPTFPPRR